MNLGSSLASSILAKIFPLRPRTRCWAFPLTVSMLFKGSYRNLWSRLRCFSVWWFRIVSYAPFVSFGKILFTHMAPRHMGIVNWIRRASYERPGTAKFCKEFFAHRYPSLRWPSGLLLSLGH